MISLCPVTNLTNSNSYWISPLPIMRLPYSIVLIVLFCTAQLSAQNTLTVDSLATRLTTTLHDSDRANIFIDLSQEFLNSDPDTAIYLSNQALAISEKNKWLPGIGKSHGMLR